MKLKKSTILIAILILIAVGLSIAIGIKYFSVRQVTGKNASILPTPTPDSFANMLLNAPAQDATEDVKRKFFLKVIDLGKDADHLDISGCRGKPSVLFVENERPVKIINKDASAHEIALNKDARYNVPAKSNESYMLTFIKGPGVYGYGCDRRGTTAGFLIVRP